MTSLVLIALTWTLVGLCVGLVVGWTIRLANADAAPAAWTDDVDRFLQAETSKLSVSGPESVAPTA